MAAVHALDLRLQSALLRSREAEEAFKGQQQEHGQTEGDDDDDNDEGRQIVGEESSQHLQQQQQQQHQLSILHALERIGLEIDAAKAIWEDAVGKASKAYGAGNRDAKIDAENAQ